MKQLDEMERMARAMLDLRTGSYEHAPDLARALLAMMSTIRAALDWRDHGPGQSHCAEEDCPCTSTVCRLRHALDTLARRLGEG